MITKSLPSLFTIANLCLGMASIMFVFNDRPGLAAMMVIIAMLTDGLDGRVARALNAQSEFGKELDSLSDVISFGVAPAFIMYVVAFQEMSTFGWIITALFPICGALRLARFNVVEGVPGYFVGLPIPAAGGILSTLALFHAEIHDAILIASTIVLSCLMVSTFKYPSFKSMGLSRKTIAGIIVTVTVFVVLAVIFPETFGRYTKFVFIPLVLYALYGLKKKGNPDAAGDAEETDEADADLGALELEEPVKFKA